MPLASRRRATRAHARDPQEYRLDLCFANVQIWGAELRLVQRGADGINLVLRDAEAERLPRVDHLPGVVEKFPNDCPPLSLPRPRS